MEFQKFSKIPRLSRDVVISEKIDGTNGQIFIISHESIKKDIKDSEDTIERAHQWNIFIEDYNLAKIGDFYVFAGSRKRWLDTSSKGDNHDFAKWVQANARELLKLGEGRHYGEWWGKGIQRGYGLEEKRFSLFNVGKWVKSAVPPLQDDKQQYCPECCDVVPILYNGMFDTNQIKLELSKLMENGSSASPGFMNPEGIIIFHKASGQLFKKTITDDLGKNEKDKVCEKK